MWFHDALLPHWFPYVALVFSVSIKVLRAALAVCKAIQAAKEKAMPDGFDENALQAELTRDENKEPRMYKDSRGYWTAGIGRNLSVVPFSDDEIALMFCNDVKRAAAELDKGAPWWRRLDPVRQRVMLNMVFNLGWGDGHSGLSGFRHFLAAMQAGMWDAAVIAMRDSAWWGQVGQRAERLAFMVQTGRAGQ